MNRVSVREVSRSGNKQVMQLFSEFDYIEVKLKNSGVRGCDEIDLFGIYAIDYDDLAPDAVTISEFRPNVCKLLSQVEEGGSIQIKQTMRFPYDANGNLKPMLAFMLVRLAADEVVEVLSNEG